MDLAPKLAVGDLLGLLKKLDLLGHGRRLKNLVAKLDKLMERIMVEHENELNSTGKERKDMKDILLEIHKDENAEFKLNRIDIKAFFLVFL